MNGQKKFDFAEDSRILNRQPHSTGFEFRVVTQWLLSLIMLLMLTAPAIRDYDRGHSEEPTPLPGDHYFGPTISLQDLMEDFANPKIIKPDRAFDPIILEAAVRHNLDPALIKAIIMAESGFKPMAVSHRGAGGLMQLMPGTATSLGVQDVFDPEHNIHGGTKYFKYLLNRFNGDITLGLAAYNAGSRKVKQYEGIPPYEATRIYVNKVLKYYRVYKKEFN